MKNYKKLNYSKISQKLFISIYEIIKNNYDNIYFAVLNDNMQYDWSGKNNEYILNLFGKIIRPDFIVKDINKIIEFDGTYWHGKKRSNYQENKNRELQRDNNILNSGYEILHIWEKEYTDDPEGTIKKCLKFIKG